MFSKRLAGMVPEARKYVAASVALQWVALAANIALMLLMGAFVQSLVEGGDVAAARANLVMAAFAGAIAWALYGQAPALVAQSEAFAYFYLMFLPMFALINLYLLFFNLLPIPPLDGSHALNLAVSALFGPLVGDAVAALAGVLCSLALLGGAVYLYVQTRGGALVIFAALALLLSALKELRLARRAIKV